MDVTRNRIFNFLEWSSSVKGSWQMNFLRGRINIIWTSTNSIVRSPSLVGSKTYSFPTSVVRLFKTPERQKLGEEVGAHLQADGQKWEHLSILEALEKGIQTFAWRILFRTAQSKFTDSRNNQELLVFLKDFIDDIRYETYEIFRILYNKKQQPKKQLVIQTHIIVTWNIPPLFGIWS